MLFKLFRDSFRSRQTKLRTEEDIRGLICSGSLDEARVAIAGLVGSAWHLAARCLLAEIDFREGKDADAEAGFGAVLVDAPGHPDAHYGLSLLLYEKGDFDAAVRHAQFAVNTNPLEGRFVAQLGLCQVRFGNYPVAEGLLTDAVRLLPFDKTCWNNLGIVLAAKGDAAAAHRCFSKALSIDPGFQNAKSNLRLLEENADAEKLQNPAVAAIAVEDSDEGPADVRQWSVIWERVIAMHRQGRFDEAVMLAEEMVETWPDEPDVFCKAARLYASQGDSLAGLDLLSAFLYRYPHEAQVLVAMGKAQAAQRNFKAGEAFVRRAIELGDTTSQVFSALATMLQLQEKYQESADSAQQALDRSDQRPTSLLGQLGAAQVMACRYQEAIATYDELFERTFKQGNPNLGGYALCLTYLGRFEEAQLILNELLEHSPNDAGLHLQRGQIRLLCGDFAGGWDDYLYRGLSYSKFFRVLPFPRWQGQPLVGKRIIVLAEQGLGDQVMLASCFPDLVALQPAKVYVEAVLRVAPTLARSFPDCEVIATNQNRDIDWVKQCGQVDYYIPLGDLPARFRRSAVDFPGIAYLRADPVRIRHWRDLLERSGPGPYVGLSWRGGTQLTRGVLRSLPVEELKALADALPAKWVSLQYGDVQSELARAKVMGLELQHWKQAIDNLDEFAALIAALDGVITVCNTTVHYAGALGKQVWILAPQIPEWRYGIHWDRLPWYPGAHVFRQAEPGEWSRPIELASIAAKTFFERHHTDFDKNVN